MGAWASSMGLGTGTVADHQSAAAAQLYRVIADSDDSNIFISPFSISTALAMVAAGADGETASQLRLALALPEDMTKLHDDYRKVLEKLQKQSNVTLSTANNLYVRDSFHVLESYAALLKSRYMSTLRAVNFADSTGASELINNDVETATKGKIKDIIKPDGLQQTDLVLVNAIYFKGSWKYEFETRDTREEEFFVSSGKSVKTQMMNMTGSKFNCGHIPELGCKALEMLYKGDRFSMIMLLPDRVGGLKEVESQLPSSPVRNILGRLSKQEAVVTVPKFKHETSYDLIKPLQALGITDLFVSGKANLSKISGSAELFVSKVLHKAFVEVNEEGTEAAAVTAVMMSRCEPVDLPTPFYFIADHPFFFIIFDRGTGLTLFSGRYAKPA